MVNELLWGKSSPTEDSLFAYILEHPETEHTIVRILTSDSTWCLYLEDNKVDSADIDMREIIIGDNPCFGFKRIDSTIPIYKVRW